MIPTHPNVPELTMLREMANIIREYLDERNRPAVSWDGMPSVQDQKRRRDRIVELLEAVHDPSVISSASPLSEEALDAKRWRYFREFMTVEDDASSGGQYLFVWDDKVEATFAPGFDNTVESLVDQRIAKDARLSASAPSPEEENPMREQTTNAIPVLLPAGRYRIQPGTNAAPLMKCVGGTHYLNGSDTHCECGASPEDKGSEPTETSDFCAACVRGYCEDRYSIRECRGHWHVTMCGADLAIPGDPFASAEIAQRAADAENRGRDPGGEA